VVILKEKKAAIYCRSDSGRSAETRQQVLEAQRHRLKRYAEERGMQITAYYEDNGYSGNDLSRPGLAKLMADHKKGMFDVVLVVNRS
jgi:site-specific DNA recombinase